MKKYLICFIAMALLSTWQLGTCFAQEQITLATLDWEPYIGQNLKGQGYVAELVKEAFKRSGYDVKIKFYPWARVVALAKQGKVDGYFPEYFAKELKKNFLVSKPFPGGPMGLFKRKGEKIRFNSLKDLRPYKIGVVRGYVNTAEFDAASYLKKEATKDDLTNIKKLLAKRIDLMVCDKFVGNYLLSQNLPGRVGDIEFMSPPLEVKDLYVCISKKTSNPNGKLKAFDEGLDKMTNDMTIDKILTKHGF